ncbi:MAG: TRAP transporter substrate-binding protein [Planctomycetes bacterium]|nr:TRAP transporter substrate-binding protein [Planctomycetota bacterium]
MKSKRVFLLFAALLLVSTFATAAEYLIKLGHIANTDHSWHAASIKFKELVEKESGGKVRVEVYPNNEIGSEMEVIDQIHSGVAQMVISADSLANWAPAISILSVPYMVRDIPHLEKVLKSEVGEFIDRQLIEKAGMRPLAVFIRAPRNLTSKKPISTPADAQGLRMRISNVPIHSVAWEAAGAKPVPMAFSEVFTSIQQGVIDSQENPPDLIKSASFYEVQPFMNLTEHVRGWIYFLIGEDYFQTLPKDIQDILLKAGEEVEIYERKLHLDAIADIEKFLQDNGMTFNPADKQAFADAMRDACLNYLTPELRELFEKVQKM